MMLITHNLVSLQRQDSQTNEKKYNKRDVKEQPQWEKEIIKKKHWNTKQRWWWLYVLHSIFIRYAEKGFYFFICQHSEYIKDNNKCTEI